MSFQPDQSFQRDQTAVAALALIAEIKPRHRVALLLAVLGFAALAPTGASACGRLPAGVEVSGPVLRGAAVPHNVKAQPVITPHCMLAPPADEVLLNGSDDRPDESALTRLPGGSR